MSASNISERIRPMLQEALDRHCGEESIQWEFIPMLIAENQLGGFLTIIMPTGIIGQSAILSAMISNPQQAQEAEINQVVGEVIEQARRMRSQALAEGMGVSLPQEAQPDPVGTEHAVGGGSPLFVPR